MRVTKGLVNVESEPIALCGGLVSANILSVMLKIVVFVFKIECKMLNLCYTGRPRIAPGKRLAVIFLNSNQKLIFC